MKDRKGFVFRMLLLGSLAVGLITLVALIVDVIVKGHTRLTETLLFHFPSSNPEIAGAQSAIWGTIWVVGLCGLICIPVGIGAAIYLEEYANPERRVNRLIELNIQNLAAVPSIVYGILGLGFFVRGALGLGQTVMAAGLTLALGATKWQMVRRQVLPAAVPGMATGSILALSRAIGEAAPLVLLGGLTFITFNPEGVNSAFTVLPIQIFNWISRPQEEFKVLAAAAIVVLLAILLTMNAAAIYLRNRFERNW